VTAGAAPLPWQQAAWTQLGGAAAAGRLPHALLLAGPRGVGKRRFAQQLASLLLCEAASGARPCGQCRGCMQFAAGTHPNLFRLRPAEDKRDIAIDDVRALIDGLQLTGHYGGAKVALIEPADALNASSVNALLKTVEEPPRGTHLLFVSERWRALPPTLRSRCQIVRFAPPPADAARAWLKRAFPQQPDAALEPLLRVPLLAEGALDPETARRREDWVQALRELRQGRMQALKVAERVERDVARAWLEWVLETATTWLRRTLAPRSGGALAPPPGVTARALLGLLDDALEGQRALERNNGNPSMIMESIMIRWARTP